MKPKEFPTGIADVDLITLKQLDTVDLANLQEISIYLKQLIQKEFWDKVNDPDHIIHSLKGIDKTNYSVYDDIEKNGSINFYLEGYPHSKHHKLLDRNGFNLPPSQIIIGKFNKHVDDPSKYLPDDWEIITMLQYVLEYIAKTIIVKLGDFTIPSEYQNAFCFILFDIEHDRADYDHDDPNNDIYYGAGYEDWINSFNEVMLSNPGKDLKLVADLIVNKDIVKNIMKHTLPNIKYRFGRGNSISIPLDSIRQQIL